MQLGDIATLIKGELTGDPSRLIGSLGSLGDLDGDLTFVMDRSALKQRRHMDSRAVVTTVPIDGCDYILVGNARLAMSQLIPCFYNVDDTGLGGSGGAVSRYPSVEWGAGVSVGANVVIGEGVSVGDRTIIMAGVVIMGGVRIGSDCVLYPGVVLYPRTQLGNRVRIHANAVIGSDGFGYVGEGANRIKMPHVGRVVLEDDVELGACTCIDRSVLGETRIETGVKLDNLVHVAHHCRIGAHTVVASQTGMTGGVSIGEHVQIGGQVGLSNTVVGDRAVIAARAGVTSNVPSGAVVSGFPAWDHRLELKKEAWMRRTMTRSV